MIVDILQVGKPTRSKKIYTLDVLQANIERLRPIIDARAFIGELGPNGPGQGGAAIQFANASHVITDLWVENDTLKAEVDLMETPAGMVLHRLLDSCVNVNFSLVGIGSGQVNDQGHLVIGDSYKLIQVECWAEASSPPHRLYNIKLPRYRSIDDPWTISEYQ
jgi:hypothetical protein